jgi:endonuclease/exonuclease/phosphatase family metal-dependent hydrolase
MSPRLRVGTYNVYLGADLGLLLGSRSEEDLAANQAEVERQLGVTAFPERAAAVARVLAAQHLDLVGLQEVCCWRLDGRPLWDFAAELLGCLEEAGTPFDLVSHQPTFGGSGRTRAGDGVVTLSLEGHNSVLRRRDSPVRVEETGDGLFVGAYTVPGPGSADVTIARGWCGARCSVDGRAGTDFWFLDTHTEAYDAPSRDEQRDEMLDALPSTDLPTLLVGDFNATPAEVGMPADFADAWAVCGNGEGPTAATCCQGADLSHEDSRLRDRIDYVWVRDAAVVDCWRFGADPADRTEKGLWPSDHAGVAAEVTLPR